MAALCNGASAHSNFRLAVTHIHWNNKRRTPSCTDYLSHACTSKVEAAFLCSFSHARTIKEEHRYANCTRPCTRKHVFMWGCQNHVYSNCLQVMIGTLAPQVKMATIKQNEWVKLIYLIRGDYNKLAHLLSLSLHLHSLIPWSFPHYCHDLLRPEGWYGFLEELRRRQSLGSRTELCGPIDCSSASGSRPPDPIYVLSAEERR